jgi:tripartite-type tricarboxylate transporter receptor subunit TctC
MLRKSVVVIAFGAVAATTAVPANVSYAQPYPGRYIRLLATEPGGGNDLVARLVAQGMEKLLGQRLIVENHPGRIIGEMAGAASPDGYTLMVASSTFLFAQLFEKTKYDALADFAPVSMLARAPNILVVHPRLPVNTTEELVALAKRKPGELNYGSGGTGSAAHLAAEMFKQMAGVDIVRVNYKGTGPAINDLIGGQVQLVFAPAQAVTQHVGTGRLRALAVTSPRPSVLTPGLPTIAASGLAGYEMEVMYAIVAPANVAASIVDTLNTAAARYLSQDECKQRFLGIGLEAVHSSPDALGATMKAEIAKVAGLLGKSGR